MKISALIFLYFILAACGANKTDCDSLGASETVFVKPTDVKRFGVCLLDRPVEIFGYATYNPNIGKSILLYDNVNDANVDIVNHSVEMIISDHDWSKISETLQLDEVYSIVARVRYIDLNLVEYTDGFTVLRSIESEQG